MLKKIILGVLIVILIIVAYIGVLWFMSLNSIMDKDGMIYKEYNKNLINKNIELQERTST